MLMSDKEAFMTKTTVVWLGAMICCALWGSAFPCVKIGYRLFEIASGDTAAQILFAGSRFALAGILAIAIGSIGQHRLLVPKRGSWPGICRLSLIQTVAQYLFFYIGLANTSGVKASIIGGINVFAAILAASLLFHQEELTRRKLLGSLLGFAGLVLVNLTGNALEMRVRFTGEGFIFLSSIAYAFSSVYIKRCSKTEDPVVLSGYQFFIGGVVMIVCGLAAGGRLSRFSGAGTAMLIYLAFISAAAYSLWGILLKYNPVSKVTVFGFMNPLFGAVFSAIFLKETDNFGWKSAVALFCVCMGIYIVNTGKKEDRAEIN